MSSHENEAHEEHHSHLKTMVVVFGSLLVLTLVTVLAAQVDFGSAAINISIAMGIATIKASLVAFYFMHLKWEDKVIKWYSAVSFPLIALMLGFDIWDLAMRMAEKLYIF